GSEKSKLLLRIGTFRSGVNVPAGANPETNLPGWNELGIWNGRNCPADNCGGYPALGLLQQIRTKSGPHPPTDASDTDTSFSSMATCWSSIFRSVSSRAKTSSWTSGDWLTTRAMPSGKYWIVPCPPTSFHESGRTVFWMREMRAASIVWVALG